MAVTQQQIANLAGVSRATVDRVVNGRGHVDPEVEAKIRRIIDEVGYVPNRAGSLLQRANRPLHLGVIFQSGTPFLSEVLKELEAARDSVRQQGAKLTILNHKRMDAESQLAQLKNLEKMEVDGIAIRPIDDKRIYEAINRFVENGIPVVTFNTDMPNSKRLCYVGQDSLLGGKTCASLMGMLLGGRGKVLMVGGHQSVLAQQNRGEGFISEMKVEYPDIKLLPSQTCWEDDNIAYDIVYKALSSDSTIGGIYFTSDGPTGACHAIKDLGMRGKVRFICHDATQQNTQNMLDGYIDFIIDQNAYLQATRPLEVLTDYILTGTKPESEYLYTLIDIRNKHNIAAESIT